MVDEYRYVAPCLAQRGYGETNRREWIEQPAVELIAADSVLEGGICRGDDSEGNRLPDQLMQGLLIEWREGGELGKVNCAGTERAAAVRGDSR